MEFTANENADKRDARTRPVRTRRPGAERIGLAAIREVVDRFYERIQCDPVLASRFATVADWDTHKARLTHFWWVALGGPAYAPYRYRVVEKHRDIGVTRVEIERWLEIFSECVQTQLPESLATCWLHRARAMGASLAQVAGEGLV